MKARIIVGTSHAYACISTPNVSLDVQLKHGKSAVQSLAEIAAEDRTKAARLMSRAQLIDQAAEILDQGNPERAKPAGSAVDRIKADAARLERLAELVARVQMGGIDSDATPAECVPWIETGRTIDEQRR